MMHASTQQGVDRPVLGRALSLFSGAGGFDIGLEASGLSTVACVELDPWARQTLQTNRPSWSLFEPADVNEAARVVTLRALGLRRGELDLVVAGPPCQPFSKAAGWSSTGLMGMSDPRADAIFSLIRIIASLRPRAVLLENVAGFFSGRISALPVLEKGVDEINGSHRTNYRWSIAALDAADYGVPQRRKRTFAVARRDGKPFTFPVPTHDEKPITAWDAIGDLPQADFTPRPGSWLELLPAIPEGRNYLHLTSRGEGPELFGWRTRYWSFLLKLARDQPSWTLPASPGPNTGPFHWDNRPLTVTERLRLQGFPDGWQLSGNLRQQIKQVGNATPPPVAEAIGREIIAQLRLGDAGARHDLAATSPRLAIARRDDCPEPSPPSCIPPSHAANVGRYPAHPGTGLGPAPRARSS
ncbi:DNA cytosine methyltransferase [Mycobacterium intracellulare]|uniref:DNA cytosine methyltransferase n=1 Tax=Mycobacterium intracellulare TaxID=1767 RepID=UPI0009BD5454|nr:DNA cytosine methyltransferase [Mycobacterium intracellulare]